ncbi:hypothetical protein OP10G_3776 [Fimbriimonas ginsengisoli Gsoil 348]|uniref:Uncharacterized protein n=2 Tax=Fimbriimonas ginsengisoli TaxID=1005039 RepID=A0A068NYN7_FIMGI|nr:hypothetical protein OP10G_3776 [Fimbriimonas ginsengisoli Gsoil 348]
MRDDRTFKLTYSDDEGVERTAGTYDIEDGTVRFVIESGFGVGLPPELRLEESCLRSDRTEYARDEEVREVPVRPREEPRSRPQPRYEAGRHSGSIEGTWRMVRGNGIDSNTKFVFSSDGTFRYVGDNSSSRGRYSLSDQGIELVWSEIDGQPVDRGANVHKCLPFSYSGDAFYVDDYRYERR